jgi:hypothetical protein
MAGRLAVGWMLKRAKVVLRRARFRVGSSLGFQSITKKAVLVGSDAVVDSSLVSLSGFGAADGWVLVTCAIPGLLSPAAADGPVLSFVQVFGSDASMVTGFATSGSASSMAAFGHVLTSFGPVLESSGPKSSVQASLPFDQASSGQPIEQAFFLGVDSAVKVDSANEGSFSVRSLLGCHFFGGGRFG